MDQTEGIGSVVPAVIALLEGAREPIEHTVEKSTALHEVKQRLLQLKESSTALLEDKQRLLQLKESVLSQVSLGTSHAMVVYDQVDEQQLRRIKPVDQ